MTCHFEGAFVQCLRDKYPVLLAGTTKGEIDILNLFGVKDMGLAPVCYDNKIIGIVGVSNNTHGPSIALRNLFTVAIVANELGMALENAKIFDEVKYLAYSDSLTQVHNRTYLNIVLEDSFKKAAGGSYLFSVGIVDVDYFKKFNDSFGHRIGDVVLKILAKAMEKLTRPTDCIGRYGGEEFMFILQRSNLPDTQRYAERLRKEVVTIGKILNKRLPGRPLPVSIGVATYQNDCQGVEELVADADEALYEANNHARKTGLWAAKRLLSGNIRLPNSNIS